MGLMVDYGWLGSPLKNRCYPFDNIVPILGFVDQSWTANGYIMGQSVGIVKGYYTSTTLIS